MIYRANPKNGDKISQLGFGCMRFPRKGAGIDMEKASAIINAAVESGVNYFDTAYIYPGSEAALGEILAEGGLRDRVKIATKLPLMLVKSSADFDKFLNTQLERLKTDRIDYYLMHMLCDMQTFERLRGLGLIEWIERVKREGKIINAGFSYHGGREEFKRVLDVYAWEFCQIQYNYFDENNQAGREGLVFAYEKGLPVFVMEPLRGGMLVNRLPGDARRAFEDANGGRTLVDWALRWLWNQPEVTMLLSGMSEMSQLEENVYLAGNIAQNSLTEKDFNAYENALAAIKRAYKIPCTACGYCLPCPQGVDIPTCFACYNESFTGLRVSAFRSYMQTTGAIAATQKYASKCKKCGKCEARCPQHIEISRRLEDVSRRIESFWFRPVFAAARKIMGINNTLRR